MSHITVNDLANIVADTAPVGLIEAAFRAGLGADDEHLAGRLFPLWVTEQFVSRTTPDAPDSGATAAFDLLVDRLRAAVPDRIIVNVDRESEMTEAGHAALSAYPNARIVNFDDESIDDPDYVPTQMLVDFDTGTAVWVVFTEPREAFAATLAYGADHVVDLLVNSLPLG